MRAVETKVEWCAEGSAGIPKGARELFGVCSKTGVQRPRGDVSVKSSQGTCTGTDCK